MSDWGEDLALALRLADAADAVAVAEFRSDDLRTTHKGDGTPVSQIDLDVEQAMRDVVVAERPGDAVVGEEIGAHDGTSGRRWIFDGIDGTHNYALGRPGWATAIALEADGAIVVGVVSAPRYGRRVWATLGGGAWISGYSDHGVCDVADARSARVGSCSSLTAARTLVIPWEGMLVGWRNSVPARFAPAPASPRSESIVLDAVAAATGDVDVAILTLGEVWDYAAPSLIATEAGGVFCDAWGGSSFDTNTGVITNPSLVDEVLDSLADVRPPQPDRAQLARTVSRPIGDVVEQSVDEWRRFGIRPMVSMSARTHVDQAPPEVLNIVDERSAELERPLLGVTTDGVVIDGLRSLDSAPKVSTGAIVDAATKFVSALTPEQRARATFDVDAVEWRTWINVHMNHFRHGVMLEDLASPVRELALDILRATLSARGFDQARSIMRLNELLAELSGDHEAFGEWPYFVSIFGEPGTDAPWGWQIDGHHLCLNAMVFDGRLVMTPSFMGAEPRRVNSGPLAGISLFDPEERSGLDLIRSLDEGQRRRAIVFPSIHPDHISPQLQNLFDGRMQAGAFHDNLVARYQGVSGAELSDAQRRILLSLTGAYAGWTADRHAAVQMDHVERHLDDTWFSWYGGFDDVAPFYYRVHSPVIMIEFDHHPGVVFDNEVPTRHHVHTVVRTPNGGDYGADLLRQHHEQFDHRLGGHRRR